MSARYEVEKVLLAAFPCDEEHDDDAKMLAALIVIEAFTEDEATRGAVARTLPELTHWTEKYQCVGGGVGEQRVCNSKLERVIESGRAAAGQLAASAAMTGKRLG